MPSPCSVPGCPNPSRAGGHCGTHYQRLRRGQPLEAPPQRRGLVRVPQVLVTPETAEALRRDQERHGEPSIYRTAVRWLEERAAKIKK